MLGTLSLQESKPEEDPPCFDDFFTYEACCFFDGSLSSCFQENGPFTFARCCMKAHMPWGFIESVEEDMARRHLRLKGPIFASPSMLALLQHSQVSYNTKSETAATWRSECMDAYMLGESQTYTIFPAFNRKGTILPTSIHHKLGPYHFVARAIEARACWGSENCSTFVTSLTIVTNGGTSFSGMYLLTSPSQCSMWDVATFVLPRSLSSVSHDEAPYFVRLASLQRVQPSDACIDRGNGMNYLLVACAVVVFLPWLLVRTQKEGKRDREREYKVDYLKSQSIAIDILRAVASYDVLAIHGLHRRRQETNFRADRGPTGAIKTWFGCYFSITNYVFFVLTVRLAGMGSLSAKTFAFKLLRKVARQVCVALVVLALYPIVFAQVSPFFCVDEGSEECDWSVYASLRWLRGVFFMQPTAGRYVDGRCRWTGRSYTWAFIVELGVFIVTMAMKFLERLLRARTFYPFCVFLLALLLYQFNGVKSREGVAEQEFLSSQLPSVIVLIMLDKFLRSQKTHGLCKQVLSHQGLASLSAVALIGSMALQPILHTHSIWRFFHFPSHMHLMASILPFQALVLWFSHFEVRLPCALESVFGFLSRSSMTFMISHAFLYVAFDNLVDNGWNGAAEIPSIVRTAILMCCLAAVAHFIQLAIIEPQGKVLQYLWVWPNAVIIFAIIYVALFGYLFALGVVDSQA